MVSMVVAKSTHKLQNGTLTQLSQELSLHDRQQISQFKRWEDKQLCLFGKLLLRENLMRRGINPSHVQIQKTDYGKPFIEGGPHFNISHSGEYVVCVMTDNAVGIDIERIKPLDLKDFTDHWHLNEHSLLQNARNPLEMFYQLWTRKESVIKADGRGLSIPLASIDVSSDLVQVYADQWFITEVKLDEGYICNIAYNNPQPEVMTAVVNFQ